METEKRLVANLKVVFDPTDTKQPSGIERENGEFTLILRPYKDAQFLNEANPLGDHRRTLQTIIAHELGHFVAMITKDPTHNNPLEQYGLAPLTPGEQKAWEIAKEIVPDIDPNLENKAMESYKKQDENVPDVDALRQMLAR